MADTDKLEVVVGADISGLQAAFDAIPSAAQMAASAVEGSLSELDAAFGTVEQQAQAFSQSVSQLGSGNATQELENLAGALNADADAAAKAVPPIEQIAPALKDASESANQAAQSTETFSNQILKLGAGVLTFQALTGAIREMITAFGDIQASEIALRSFTGSAKVAADAIENIQKLANQLAVSQDSLVTFQQRLVAIGVPLANIPRLAEAAADAAAGMNVSFDTAASQMERMAESGQLMNRSLATLGIDIDRIGAAMGMAGASTAQVQEEFRKLGDATDRADVLATAFFTRFNGQANAAAQGVKGLWTVLKNDAEDAFQDLGKDLNGFTGLITTIGTAIKFVEDVIFEFNGIVKQGVDWLIVAGGDLVTLFKGIGAVVSDVMTGNFQKIPEDVKNMLDRVRAYEDAYTANSKKDWEDTTGAINKLWGDTASNIVTGANTIKTALGADEKAMLDFSKALTGVLDANRTLNQNMSDAKATLDAANTAYKLGVISVGELTAAQNAYNSALYAVNPVAQAAAQAAKAFADQIANLKIQVQSVSLDAFSALSGSSDQASAALAKVTASINQLLDAFQQTKNPKVKQDLQDLINSLAHLQTQLQAVVDQQGFQKLGDQLSELLTKYPHALDTMGAATQQWAAGVVADTAKAREGFANLTDDQVIKAFEDSLKGLSESTNKLGNDFAVSLGKIHTAATEQIQITKDWRVEIGEITNSYMEMTTLANKYHLNELTSLHQEITDLTGLVGLQQRFGVAQSQILSTQAKLLQAQLDLGAATGATADQALAWQEQLTAVQIKQNLLKEDTLALANLYKDMVGAFGKAWDELGTNIGDALVSGQNFGAAISKVLDDLKKSIAELVTNYLLGELKRAFLENTDAVNTFGKVFSALFGGEGSSGSLGASLQAFDKQLMDGMDKTVATVGEAGNAVQASATKMSTSMQSTAQSVSASASQMVSGLTAVASVVSAIASIFSAIELMHTNTLLDRIEHETARMAIYLGDSGSNSIQFYTGKTAEILGYLHTTIVQMSGDLQAIRSTLLSIAANTLAGGAGGSGGAAAFAALQKEIEGALNVFSEELAGPYGLGAAVDGVSTGAAGLATQFSNLSTSTSTLGSTLTAAASTVSAASVAVASSFTAITKATPVPATVAYSPGSNTFTPIIPSTNVPSVFSGPGGSNSGGVTALPQAGGSGGGGIISIEVNVQAGVVAGQGGMQMLADMVGKSLVNKMQTNTGLKLR